jgi:hypothetical protein
MLHIKITHFNDDPLSSLLVVGTGADPGFNAQERTNNTLTTGPFGNTCEADEVSPEVEGGVVAGLRCLQPYLGHKFVIILLTTHLASVIP